MEGILHVGVHPPEILLPVHAMLGKALDKLAVPLLGGRIWSWCGSDYAGITS